VVFTSLLFDVEGLTFSNKSSVRNFIQQGLLFSISFTRMSTLSFAEISTSSSSSSFKIPLALDIYQYTLVLLGFSLPSSGLPS